MQPNSSLAADVEPLRIDTHQHLWDLSKQKMPWLTDAPEILKHDYRSEEYAAEAFGGWYFSGLARIAVS